ncbi:site-2 protease family protein [Thermoflavimicrobium dichotomicum]|uniref:Zn-dependent protease (Includes SpoIVFB) n=1 Tax=Thermoflavimicrobium dichotomicum TaxID=46223 RepID=A0A1I3QTQ5_9BACL|nr:site-2 protease family protein [Thermoflavimicrobium dichotomicum]SFJ36842.1 Zn-dependent protease (includes SpoIVFB) [Thermoflavimicrobium dichotomicum]
MSENRSKKPRGRIASWLVGLGAVLLSLGGKLKSLLPLLKLGKFGGTIISLVISVWAYTVFYPLELAIGLVLLILIHELGHVWAAKRKGLPVTAPAFIPFLGALIMMKRQPQDAVTEAYIAYGGPLVGTIGALACYGLGMITDNEVFYVIAMLGFFINLFNLIPVHPLDGGRIVVAITRWLWVVGLVIGLALIIYLQSLLLLVFYLLFVFEIWSTFRKRKQGLKPRTIRQVLQVPTEHFLQNGVWVPGEEHRRPLFFRQYCDLNTQMHMVDIEYPGVGVIGRFNEFEGQIEKVELIQTRRMDDVYPSIVQMVIEITYFVSSAEFIEKEKRYFQIPLKKRIQFSVAYVGLIALLIYMMVITYPFIERVPTATG